MGVCPWDDCPARAVRKTFLCFLFIGFSCPQFALGKPSTVGSLGLGSPERGHPDLFRFPSFLPICSDLRSLFSGIPRFVPICSALLRILRFVLLCFQNKSEQIRETPFCRPLLQFPNTTETGCRQTPSDLVRNSGVGGGGQNLILILSTTLKSQTSLNEEVGPTSCQFFSATIVFWRFRKVKLLFRLCWKPEKKGGGVQAQKPK